MIVRAKPFRFMTIDWDRYSIKCSCQEWQRSHEKWGAMPRPTSSPLCRHVIQTLENREDHLPDIGIIDIPMLFHKHELSVDVSIDDFDSGLVAINWIVYLHPYEVFVGFMPAKSSRYDVRAYLFPVLVQRFVDQPCLRCHGESYAGTDLRTGEGIREAVYTAGYIERHTGVCPNCDDSDLVPNPSPNPTHHHTPTRGVF